MSNTPQPTLDRLVPFAGHPLVAGVVPDGCDMVVHTALNWARALQIEVYFAYVDPSRVTIAENPDGTVRHAATEPNALHDDWQQRNRALRAWLAELCADHPIRWHFRYLAGRPDRALTHLARAVNASAFVIGAHGRVSRWRPEEYLNRSVAVRLSHHQHRPVLIVPSTVVDWRARTPWQ